MKNILVIEDDKESQDLYRQVLEKEQFHVIQAVNVQQGLDLAFKQNPDLILLDIMLPGGLNGFDMLEQLKREDKTKGIPVIVLTNLDSEEKNARSIGVADYIVKTTTSLGEIVEKVKKALDNSSQ